MLYSQELCCENNEQLRLRRALHLQTHGGTNQGDHRIQICDYIVGTKRNPEGCLVIFLVHVTEGVWDSVAYLVETLGGTNSPEIGTIALESGSKKKCKHARRHNSWDIEHWFWPNRCALQKEMDSLEKQQCHEIQDIVCVLKLVPTIVSITNEQFSLDMNH
jgi:hypothetical protein